MGAKVHRTRIKICGMTRREDARFAADLGVDALGFIFYEKSPRAVSTEQAHQIIVTLPPLVSRVGVFVNADFSKIETAVEAGINVLQLHGDESVENCQYLRKRFPSCSLIKAFRVGGSRGKEALKPYEEVADCFLLDTYKKGEPGGTGEVFDWGIVEQLNMQKPILLAGGLGPENIAQAIQRVHPYCVDVNSGVEIKPGVKDHDRLLEVVQAVKTLDAQR